MNVLLEATTISNTIPRSISILTELIEKEPILTQYIIHKTQYFSLICECINDMLINDTKNHSIIQLLHIVNLISFFQPINACQQLLSNENVTKLFSTLLSAVTSNDYTPE